MQAAANIMSVSVQRHTAQVADDFARAFSALIRQHANGLITFPGCADAGSLKGSRGICREPALGQPRWVERIC
jgi:hypothetical protein